MLVCTTFFKPLPCGDMGAVFLLDFYSGIKDSDYKLHENIRKICYNACIGLQGG